MSRIKHSPLRQQSLEVTSDVRPSMAPILRDGGFELCIWTLEYSLYRHNFDFFGFNSSVNGHFLFCVRSTSRDRFCTSHHIQSRIGGAAAYPLPLGLD